MTFMVDWALNSSYLSIMGRGGGKVRVAVSVCASKMFSTVWVYMFF